MKNTHLKNAINKLKKDNELYVRYDTEYSLILTKAPTTDEDATIITKCECCEDNTIIFPEQGIYLDCNSISFMRIRDSEDKRLRDKLKEV